MIRLVRRVPRLRNQDTCALRTAESRAADACMANGCFHSTKMKSKDASKHHCYTACQSIQQARFLSSAVPKLDLQTGPLSPRTHISLDELSSQTTFKKPKKKRQKKKKGQSKSNVASIPKQSSYTTRILFDSIAPHIEFRTLHQLTKQLSQLISRGHHKLDVSDFNVKKRTIKRRLETLFESESNSDEPTLEYSWSIKSHRWIQPVIYQYIMGKHLEATHSKRRQTTNSYQKLSPNEDQTYPPYQNSRNYQRNLQTVMKARQMSLVHPIFWTEKLMKEFGFSYSGKKVQPRDPQRLAYLQEISRLHSLKDEEQLQDDADHLLQLLMDCLPPPHFDKVMRSLEDYTKLDDNNISESSESSWCIDETDDDENSKHIRNEPVKGRRIPILGKFLGACSSSHSHLVAVELGQFLYVKLPSTGREETNQEDNNGDNFENSLDISELTASEAAHALRKHRKLLSSDKRYQKTKEDFVRKMMEVQHDFASWDEESVKDSSTSSDSDAVDDNDDSSDLQVTQFEKQQRSYNADTRKMQKEELAETLAELRRMGIRTDEDDSSKMRRRGRPRKGKTSKFHVYFLRHDWNR